MNYNELPDREIDMLIATRAAGWRFAHATPEQRSKAALVAWAKVQAHRKEGE